MSPPAVTAAGRKPQAHLSPSRLAWRRLKANRMAMAGLAFLLFFSGLCVVGPWFSPYSFQEQPRIAEGALPPSAEHWLGTDHRGRDLATRLFHGGRISLMVGLLATAVSLSIGVVYGSLSGFLGGKSDSVMMRIVDILYALPFTVFVILLMVFFGRSLILLFLAIGAVEWLTMARIVRGQVLSLKQTAFVEAARILGQRPRKLLSGHILPNALGPIIVYTALTIPNVMLLEAFVSFLGLGVQPPMSSLGLLINDGRTSMEGAPWLLLAPGIAFAMTLFSLNFLGDGIRDAFDPKKET